MKMIYKFASTRDIRLSPGSYLISASDTSVVSSDDTSVADADLRSKQSMHDCQNTDPIFQIMIDRIIKLDSFLSGHTCAAPKSMCSWVRWCMCTISANIASFFALFLTSQKKSSYNCILSSYGQRTKPQFFFMFSSEGREFCGLGQLQVVPAARAIRFSRFEVSILASKLKLSLNRLRRFHVGRSHVRNGPGRALTDSDIQT